MKRLDVHGRVFFVGEYNMLRLYWAYRTKSVCENPYDTSKYLVL